MEKTGQSFALMLLSLMLAATATATATVRPSGPHGSETAGPRDRPFADGGLSLDEAVARVERRYDARAVRAEQKKQDGRIVYRIRLLSADGRVFEVQVDARSGAQL